MKNLDFYKNQRTGQEAVGIMAEDSSFLVDSDGKQMYTLYTPVVVGKGESIPSETYYSLGLYLKSVLAIYKNEK